MGSLNNDRDFVEAMRTSGYEKTIKKLRKRIRVLEEERRILRLDVRKNQQRM